MRKLKERFFYTFVGRFMLFRNMLCVCYIPPGTTFESLQACSEVCLIDCLGAVGSGYCIQYTVQDCLQSHNLYQLTVLALDIEIHSGSREKQEGNFVPWFSLVYLCFLSIASLF